MGLLQNKENEPTSYCIQKLITETLIMLFNLFFFFIQFGNLVSCLETELKEIFFFNMNRVCLSLGITVQVNWRLHSRWGNLKALYISF